MARTLREEIRQSRAFGSLEQEAYLSLVRTAALLTDHLDQVLATAGLTLAQYNVLRILRGSQPDGLCRNDLRDRMLTRMPDMTRLLDRMEAAGLVTRDRDSEDRRQVTTRITAQGRKLLSELEQPVAAEHQRCLGHLGKAELRKLIALLGDVRDSV